MDNRRSSWPWRKKTISTSSSSSSSQRKISQYLFMHNASFDANFSDNGGSDRSFSVHNKHEQEAPDQSALKTTLQAISVKDQHIDEDKVRNLTEKLNISLAELKIKPASFGQHSKVAEEALTGWERSEAEIASLNRELEGLVKQKAMADARVSQLDDALKECMKQVRQVREEQQQKISEAIDHKTQEWRKIKAELEARQSEMAQRLMESNAQNSVMNKSLQERGKAMVELREAKAKAETEVKLLQVKVESMEKAMSASKYELHVLKKELHLCVEERETNQKAMEASQRQHVEDARKIARLESDCTRLRALVKKKINSSAGLCNHNSPASVAQIMKAEAADIFYYSGSSASSSSSSSSRKTGAFDHNSTRPWRRRSYASDQGITNLHHLQEETVIETAKHSNSNSDIVAMSERLMAMEEETRKLQETLAKRNAELDSARQNMPTSVGSMINGNFVEQSVLATNNDHLLPGVMEISTPTLTMIPSKQGGNSDHDRVLSQCAETISISSEKLHDDDELSCAESSGANSDGAQISLPSTQSRSADDTQSQKELVMAMEIQINEDGAKDTCHDTDHMFNVDHHIIIERKHRLTDQDCRALQTNLAEIRLETKLQSANLLCKDALSKIASLDRKDKAHELVDPDAPERIGDSRDIVIEAYGMMVKLDAILDELRIAVASCSGDNSDEEDDHTAAVKHSSNPSLMEPDHGDGDRNIIRLNHSEEVQLSDKLREAKDEMEKEIANVKAELNLRKEELAEARRVIMEFEAQLLEVKSRSTEERLAQHEEDEKSLRQVEVELDRWKRAASEEKTRRAEAEEGLRKAEVEVSKLQKAIATLTVDLTEQRKEYQEGCEALSQKLQGFLQDRGVEDRNSCRYESIEHQRVRKDREVVAAKGKLAECQRTILMLEKQLTSLGNNNSTKSNLIKESNVASNNTQEGSIINKISPNNGNHMVHNNPHVINNNHQWPHRHPQLVVDQPDNHHNNYNSINPHLINHQKPLRVHSDHIGYRGMINENNNNNNNNQYSVADYLLMDEDHQLMDHPAPPLILDYHQMNNSNNMRSNSTVHERITYHNINQVNSTNYTHSHNHDRRSSSLQLRMINADSNPNPKTNSKPNPNNLQRSSIASFQSTECNPGFGSRFFSRSNTRK